MPQVRRRSSGRTRARATRASGRRDERSKIAQPVRLYVVEDMVNFIEALRTSPELAAHNVKLVGSSTRNVVDLPKRVARAKADVVLIDVDLGPPRSLKEIQLGDPLLNGLAACEALKRSMPRIRILVWSHLAELARQDALDAGADHYETRVLSLPTLLQTIKRVARNQPVLTRASTASVGRIVGIRLLTRDRKLTVQDSADRSVMVKLKPVGFALLWYLALERLAETRDWLKPEYPGRPLVYRIEKPNLWRRICATSGVTGHEAVVGNTILNGWKTGVRVSLKAYGKIELFGSSPGKPIGPPRCSLVDSIKQTAIEIDDPDSVTQALAERAR